MIDGSRGFAEYFKKLYEANEGRVPQTVVAEKLGITQGALSKMLRGAMIPSDELALKIIKKWSLDEKEFMDLIYMFRQESGAKFFREAKKREEVEPKEVVIMPTKPRLPVSAAAGRLSIYVDGVMRHQCDEMPIIRSLPDYDFTMFIKGNSMEPKYESGDEIALRKATIIEWGKDYVLDTDDGPIFKKIYEDGDNIRCVSYNHDEYPDFLVPKESIYGFYRFVGLVRV